jgi:hypothetical protein
MRNSLLGMALVFCCALVLVSPAVARGAPDSKDYFTITVVDHQTGRGVPLVELSTTNDAVYYTDSNGVVAFHEPGLMNQVVYFHIKSHGYEYPKDFLGFRGKALKVTKGDSAVLRIKRLNVAERLYRITGEGIYRDSVLVGHPVPTKQPLLNGAVMGQTPSSPRRIAGRSTGSGVIRIASVTRWATLARRALLPSCRAAAALTPAWAST